jgi:hypothetical protein
MPRGRRPKGPNPEGGRAVAIRSGDELRHLDGLTPPHNRSRLERSRRLRSQSSLRRGRSRPETRERFRRGTRCWFSLTPASRAPRKLLNNQNRCRRLRPLPRRCHGKSALPLKRAGGRSPPGSSKSWRRSGLTRRPSSTRKNGPRAGSRMLGWSRKPSRLTSRRWAVRSRHRP